jgi:hypothetical protein
MIRPLIPACLLGAVAVSSVSTADAQTQIRNFNLSCGLIGKFVRYPPHLQHCKTLIVCDDRRLCRKRKSIAKLPAAELALSAPTLGEQVPGVSPENPATDSPADTSSPGDNNAPGAASDNSDGLGASSSASAGVAGGGISAGTGGGASIGSGSANNASAGAGGGASVGGAGVSAGGSLGVGGL